MLSQLEWEPLEHRRAAQRLTFLYKSVNKLVAVDTSHYQSKVHGVTTRNKLPLHLSKYLCLKTVTNIHYSQEHLLNGIDYHPMLGRHHL